MTTFAQLDRARDRHRAVASRALLAVAVLVPACVLFIQAWGNERRGLDAMTKQQHGVAYVRALQSLIGAVAAAQSVAVSGGTVSLRPIDRAALAVTAVDQSFGVELRTQVLWADADNRIQQLHSRSQAAPADAFASYSAVTGLLLSLSAKVGATAGLSHDSHPEMAALQDGAARQLPAVVVAGGAYADLMVLAGGADGSSPGSRSGATAGPNAALGTPPVSIADQLANQRAAIERYASDLVDDVQNASDTSPDAAISETTLSRLDKFRIEVDALVADRANGDGSIGAAAVHDAAKYAAATQAAASTLGASMLQSVDGLLVDRIDAQRRVQMVTLGVGILAIVIALAPLMWAAVRRRRSADEPAPVDVVASPVPSAAPTFTPSMLGQPRFAEGGPLPRRQPPMPAVAATPSTSSRRELMPVGVMHHRRSASGAPPSTRPTGTDVAVSSDDWGRTGAAR
jgi:hypothetical protein